MPPSIITAPAAIDQARATMFRRGGLIEDGFQELEKNQSHSTKKQRNDTEDFDVLIRDIRLYPLA